jgi:hypothetical protein
LPFEWHPPWSPHQPEKTYVPAAIFHVGLDMHGCTAAGGLLLLLRLVASLRTAVHEHRRDLEKCSYAWVW